MVEVSNLKLTFVHPCSRSEHRTAWRRGPGPWLLALGVFCPSETDLCFLQENVWMCGKAERTHSWAHVSNDCPFWCNWLFSASADWVGWTYRPWSLFPFPVSKVSCKLHAKIQHGPAWKNNPFQREEDAVFSLPETLSRQNWLKPASDICALQWTFVPVPVLWQRLWYPEKSQYSCEGVLSGSYSASSWRAAEQYWTQSGIWGWVRELEIC